jgi:transposase
LTKAREACFCAGMGNVLSDDKRQQVVTLGRLGWSLRRIEDATDVRRETASAYLKAAGIEVRGRGRPPGRRSKPATTGGVSTDSGGPKPAISEGVSTDPGPAKPAISPEVSTDCEPSGPLPRSGRAPSASACEPFRELIVEALTRGRNAMGIWQDLVDDHGFRGRYASVKRFVVKLRGQAPVEARVVITTSPGEEGQVDYGEGPMVRDAASGKYRRTRLFVLTLGYSRKSVRLIVWRSSAQVWAELHERAFRRLGGTVRWMVLDNLAEGVLTPDIYDPALNPLYRDVLGHYGVVALPCRVKDPDRKGKVEAAVGHAQKTPLKGQRFETIEQAQAYLDRWEERWADTRIHGTTKRQVGVMFAEEKPALGPLPIEPFRYYRYGERTVHLDGCVEVEAAYYGAPPGWIGRRLRVQWDELHVRLMDPRNGLLLREHLRQKRGLHRLHEDDRPARTPRSTESLLQRARNAGTHVGALCEQIHRHDGEPGVRRLLGVLSLARKHGAAAADEAAQAALELGLPTYRFLRRYLERRNQAPITLKQVDPLIRQLTIYRALIEQKTGEPA